MVQNSHSTGTMEASGRFGTTVLPCYIFWVQRGGSYLQTEFEFFESTIKLLNYFCSVLVKMQLWNNLSSNLLQTAGIVSYKDIIIQAVGSHGTAWMC